MDLVGSVNRTTQKANLFFVLKTDEGKPEELLKKEELSLGEVVEVKLNWKHTIIVCKDLEEITKEEGIVQALQP